MFHGYFKNVFSKVFNSNSEKTAYCRPTEIYVNQQTCFSKYYSK